MAITIDAIRRYPLKGCHGERLPATTLTIGAGVSGDRRFAIARGDTRVDPAAPRWMPKQRFVMLMRDTALARLDCRIDEAAGTVAIMAPDRSECVAAFATAEGRARLETYVNDILGERREGRASWIEAGAVSFTDVPQNCLSLVNLASVRELETRMGRTIDPQRFRANLYLDGAPPWVEFDWIGAEVRIGSVRLRIPRAHPTLRRDRRRPDHR